MIDPMQSQNIDAPQLVLTQRKPPSLHDINNEANTILWRASTVFPFTLFPDEVVVSLSSVDIVYRPFFFSKQVFPILIKDLVTVTVSTNLLFGSLSLEVRFQEQNPPDVNYLWKDDALRLRRIITGLLTAYKEGVDLSKYSPHEILEEVDIIGSSHVASIPA
ncbi:MAG TPA: hypothetical protein VF209_04410 [Patescibacteria group bacterium]